MARHVGDRANDVAQRRRRRSCRRPRSRSARPGASCSSSKDGVANVRPVKVARTVGHESVIDEGPAGRRDRGHRRPIVAERRNEGGAARAAEGRVLTDVPFRALHPPAGPHHADHGGDHRVRRVRLPAAAGLGAAAGRFPDHRDHGDPAGREPGDHGGVGRFADRAADVDHRRHQLDDRRRPRSAPRASPSSSTSTATSMPPRSTCRPRSPSRSAGCRWR